MGDKRGEAAARNSIGMVYAALGEKGKALEYYEQALPLIHQVGDHWGGEATTLCNIGAVYDALGEKRKALAHYEQALPLLRQVGDHLREAETLYNTARALNDLSDVARAEDAITSAIALDMQLGRSELDRDRDLLASIQSQANKQKPP